MAEQHMQPSPSHNSTHVASRATHSAPPPHPMQKGRSAPDTRDSSSGGVVGTAAALRVAVDPRWHASFKERLDTLIGGDAAAPADETDAGVTTESGSGGAAGVDGPMLGRTRGETVRAGGGSSGGGGGSDSLRVLRRTVERVQARLRVVEAAHSRLAGVADVAAAHFALTTQKRDAIKLAAVKVKHERFVEEARRQHEEAAAALAASGLTRDAALLVDMEVERIAQMGFSAADLSVAARIDQLEFQLGKLEEAIPEVRAREVGGLVRRRLVRYPAASCGGRVRRRLSRARSASPLPCAPPRHAGLCYWG